MDTGDNGATIDNIHIPKGLEIPVKLFIYSSCDAGSLLNCTEKLLGITLPCFEEYSTL